MSKPPKVLICGLGIAGSAFAYCLLRAYPNADITIIERDASPRLTGASVDIRDAAVEIIKWAGMEPTIRSKTTKEEGVAFVGSRGNAFATFKATGRDDIQSFSSEYEIFRGDLAKILNSPIEDKVKLIFNETVSHYSQHEKGVTVTFTNSQKEEDFDLLIAADGLGSKIRGTMLNCKPREHISAEGCHVAFFTVDKDLLNGSRMAKWHNLPGGRVVFLRPDPHPKGRTRAHFMSVTWPDDTTMRDRLNNAIAEGDDAYKALMQEQFQDGDWLCKEVLEGMHSSEEFYCSQFAQVKSPKLQDGRVVLLGDAGYATPGIGTSLAMIGGYVLAGELLTNGGDIAKATARYEEYMLKLAKKEQSDNLFIQYLNPQTKWGLRIRDSIVRVLAGLRVDYWAMLIGKWFGWTGTPMPLPKYQWPEERVV